MIKLQVIGNLGKDCIVNNVNGKTVINFSVAHSEKYKDAQGELKEKTTWVECAYWTDKTAISPYLVKGKTVYAEGTPEVRTYQTNDGRQGATLQMRVHTVQLIGGSGTAATTSAEQASTTARAQTPAPAGQAANGAVPDDGLPF